MKFVNWLRSLFGSPYVGGALDVPDKRDYIDGLPKKKLKLPDRVSLFERAGKQFRQNTGKFISFLKQSRGACTAYAFDIVKVITNLCLHGETISHDPDFHWKMQCVEYDASPSTDEDD